MEIINHRTFQWLRLPTWPPEWLNRCNRRCSWDSRNSSFRRSRASSSSVPSWCSCRRRGSDTTASTPRIWQSRRIGSRSLPAGSSSRRWLRGTGRGRRNTGTDRTSSRFLVKSRSKPSRFNLLYYNDNRFEFNTLLYILLYQITSMDYSDLTKVSLFLLVLSPQEKKTHCFR